MTATRDDLVRLVELMRVDLSAAQAKLTQVKAELVKLPLPETRQAFVCPVPSCGVSRPSAVSLRDHLANVHGHTVALENLEPRG